MNSVSRPEEADKKMRSRKSYSIVRLTVVLIVVLLLITILISASYCISFLRSNYRENLTDFQTGSYQQVQTLNRNISVVQRQVAWIASSFGNSDYWITDNAYEKMLYGVALNEVLDGIMPSTKADAVFVTQRSFYGMIWESHSMEEGAFLSLLNTFSGRLSSIPVSPSLFGADGTSAPTYMVFSEPVYAINDASASTQHKANAYMALPLDTLLEPISSDLLSCLCLRSGDYLSVCHTVDEVAGTLRPGSRLTLPREEERMTLENGKYIAFAYPLEIGEYYVLFLLPEQQLTNMMVPTIIRTLLLFFCMLGVAVVGILLLFRRIYVPIREMTGDMERIRRGEYEYRLGASEVTEMQALYHSVNAVLDELEQRTDQMMAAQKDRYERELLYKESRFMALQSQINPHFLYNTLECVRSIAWSYRIPEISQILANMIKIYRYSASNNAMGTVESELACVRQYMEIMDVRFGKRYRMTAQVAEDILGLPLPRMVLQPLVENAITHGLSACGYGEILLTGGRTGGEAILRVRDNGAGIPPEKLAEIRQQFVSDRPEQTERSRIGLYNIAQRLRHTAEESYSLTIDSEEGQYTEVTIHICEDGEAGEK